MTLFVKMVLAKYHTLLQHKRKEYFSSLHKQEQVMKLAGILLNLCVELRCPLVHTAMNLHKNTKQQTSMRAPSCQETPLLVGFLLGLQHLRLIFEKK